MRRTRRIILLLIVVILAAVGFIYSVQKSILARNAPSPPPVLPDTVSARADNWQWEETRDGKPIVRVWARDFRQNADGTRIDLEGVELHLFGEDGKTYDRVRSAKADFDLANGKMFSEGDVEITMGMREDADPAMAGRLVTIRTSGVHFDSKTGQAFTDRPATFHFDRGEGQSVGAEYKPQTRELFMHREVRLKWNGTTPDAVPMEIEAGSLVYKELSSEVLLTPWSKFRRATLAMEGGNALVHLKDGSIEKVDAVAAKGVETQPDRTVEYGADNLHILFADNNVLQSVAGDQNARLVSTTSRSTTTVTSGRLDLKFRSEGDESILQTALATSDAVVNATPLPRAKTPTPDTRILRSNIISLNMKPNGAEMDRVETGGPGRIEFIPNRTGSKKRVIDGERMTIEYGEENAVKSFSAVGAATRTEHAGVKGKPAPAPALTWSDGLAAHFDAKSGAVSHVEQWGNFRYEEGDRHAKAERADLYSPSDDIVLTGAARVWDPTGSTAADKITLRQKSGEVEAAGKVSSTREPEKKKQSGGGMMAGDEPIQAKAARMTTTHDNRVITYESDALVWQGPNRITADRIRIDRRTNRLEATGSVVSQLVDKGDAKKSKPEFTVVRAPELIYDDKTRLAHYRGGATLNRSGMVVTAKEIRAWLKGGDAESSFDRAFADGDVRIEQTAPDRKRTGTSEHAEYYADSGKIVLAQGEPQFMDTVKGTTRGRQITYYANDDRLFVEGDESKRVESKILRR